MTGTPAWKARLLARSKPPHTLPPCDRYAGRQTALGTGIALTGLLTTAAMNATAVFGVAVAAGLRQVS